MLFHTNGDQGAIFPGPLDEFLHRRFVTFEEMFVAILGQQQEPGEIAEPVVNDPDHFAGVSNLGLMRRLRLWRRPQARNVPDWRRENRVWIAAEPPHASRDHLLISLEHRAPSDIG